MKKNILFNSIKDEKQGFSQDWKNISQQNKGTA
jgi:hypothetical protein